MKLSLSQEKLLILSQKYKWQIILVTLGVVFLVVGVLSIRISNSFGGDKVEVLGDSLQNEDPNKEIIVEISGAVEKPGVYRVSGNSRVNDVLVLAGGVSADADRVWIDKTINKAAKLSDGQKIYIPKLDQTIENKTQTNNSTIQTSSEAIGLISINTATQKELESLVGIGPTYATKIIEQRPYSDINELVSKKIIPQSTFDKIKDQISVY